jgi:hypothetical protein
LSSLCFSVIHLSSLNAIIGFKNYIAAGVDSVFGGFKNHVLAGSKIVFAPDIAGIKVWVLGSSSLIAPLAASTALNVALLGSRSLPSFCPAFPNDKISMPPRRDNGKISRWQSFDPREKGPFGRFLEQMRARGQFHARDGVSAPEPTTHCSDHNESVHP